MFSSKATFFAALIIAAVTFASSSCTTTVSAVPTQKWAQTIVSSGSRPTAFENAVWSGTTNTLVIVADTTTGALHALDATTTTGSVVWTKQYTGIMPHVATSNSGDDFAVVATMNGANLVAFRASTGEPYWTLDMGGSGDTITAAPSIEGSILAVAGSTRVYAGTVSMTSTPTVFSLNITTAAAPLATMRPLIVPTQPGESEPSVFVFDVSNNIYRFKVTSNSNHWQILHAVSCDSPNAVFVDNKIMFLAADAKLHAHNFSTGTTVWKAPSGSSKCVSPVTFDSNNGGGSGGGRIYVTCEDGMVHAFQNLTAPLGSNAEVAWSFTTPGGDSQLRSGAAVIPGTDYLYFGSSGLRRVYALDLSSSSASSASSPSPPVLVLAQDDGLSSEEGVVRIPAIVGTTAVVTGSWNKILGFTNDGTTSTTTTTVAATTTTTAAGTPPPSSSTPSSPNGWTGIIPVQFVINTRIAVDTFDYRSFALRVFSRMGLSQSTTYQRLEASPLGGPLYSLRLGFFSASTVSAIVGMTDQDRAALGIDSVMEYVAPTSRPPVLKRDLPAPVGEAIGVTVGVTVVFFVLFGIGVWKYSKADPPGRGGFASFDQDDLASAAVETQHQQFTFSGSGAHEAPSTSALSPVDRTAPAAVAGTNNSVAGIGLSSGLSDSFPIAGVQSSPQSSQPYSRFDHDDL